MQVYTTKKADSNLLFSFEPRKQNLYDLTVQKTR